MIEQDNLNQLNKNYQRIMDRLDENLAELDLIQEKLLSLTVALSYQGDSLETLSRITDILVINAK